MDNQGTGQSDVLSQTEKVAEKKIVGDKPLLRKDQLNVIVSVFLILVLDYFAFLFITFLLYIVTLPFEGAKAGTLSTFLVFGSMAVIIVVFNIFFSKYLSRKYQKRKQAFRIIFWTPILVTIVLFWKLGVFSNMIEYF